LKEKLLAKRADKAIEESKENKANEALRRKAGKVRSSSPNTGFHDFEYLSQQDINKLKEELRAKEAIKEVEAKRRGIGFFFLSISSKFLCFAIPEKIEDAKARAAIKAQIEADKKARAEKAAREKAIRDGQVIESTPVAAPTPAAVAGMSSSEAKETRLQIRLSTGGPPLTTTLSSDAREFLFFRLTRMVVIIDGIFIKALREVAEYIAGQSLSVDVETVTLAQHFPRYDRFFF